MKIVTIIGARPQFIKAATVSRAIQSMPSIEEVLVHTGQHYDENMSDVFFDELEIPKPAYDLGIGSGSHGAQTGKMLEAIERVLLDEKPNWVLVYGDTNSTLAGAVAAVKLHIPVAHVEAGLRSFNRAMPEEINRILTDHAANLLFAPTETAVNHLHHEGIDGQRIHRVGDVMYDAALFYGIKADQMSDILSRLELVSKRYMLATVHRAENTDDPKRLRAIMAGLSAAATDEYPVVLPLHPRTRATLERKGTLTEAAKQIRLIDPVGYLDMVMLEKNAVLIATDSGGVQKEAFFHGVPCVTLRDETEWVELVEAKWNRLCAPTSKDQIAATLRDARHTKGDTIQPYGNGNAAGKIVEILNGS